MQKKYKIFLWVIASLLLLIGGLTIYMEYFRNKGNNDTNISNVVHDIKKYGYSLDDRDTKLMKEEFYTLEDILKKDEIDYEEYAKSLSKLFVIDLFTINNKINKYDVGGVEYLLDSEQNKFKSIIMDSIYENVLDNTYHKREQELPEVKSVVINEIKEDSYLKGEETVESYMVSLTWDYVLDMGYDNEAIITLIKEENKLFIVEYNPEVVAEGEIE